MNDQPPPKRRRGCLFYGCITGLVLMLLLVGALLFALYQVKKIINQFTDSQPMALPTLQMSQPEIEQVRARFDAFQKALGEGQSASPLELSGNDLNALLESNTNLGSFRRKVFVSVEGDQIKGQISLPLKETGLPLVKNRYLNGSAGFKISLRNGVLNVTVGSVTVKGKPVPEVYMQSLRSQNFAQGVNNDPQTMKSLEKIQSIEVTNSHLLIIPREKQ